MKKRVTGFGVCVGLVLVSMASASSFSNGVDTQRIARGAPAAQEIESPEHCKDCTVLQTDFVTSIPEPASLALLGLSVLWLGIRLRRK